MKSLNDIQSQIRVGSFEFTRHAFKRAVERNISEQEIRELGMNLELIEDYPEDKYSPSCLLLGFTQSGRAIHIQVSRLAGSEVKIITIYEPDNAVWIDYRRRQP
jgi:hypothetical protein